MKFNPFNPLDNTKEQTNDSGEPISEELVFSFSPAKFDSFVKVLSLFDKSSEVIKITQSNIVQQLQSSTAIISADITKLFDDKEIDLDIVQPKKYVKLFKQFRNNENISIIDDSENRRYIYTNGELKLFLPKQASTDDGEQDTLMPDFEDCEGLYTIKIDKESSKQLLGLSSDNNFIEYLIQDDKLKGVHVPETAIYLFADYLKDKKAAKLDETNADLILRSGAFLNVPAEDYEIQIGKLKNGNFFSVTACNTGMLNINIIETLEPTTGGNILI